MRKEKGFFVSLEFERSSDQEEVWYGPQKSPSLSGQAFENISTNGTVLFPSQEEADVVLPSLANWRGLVNPHVGYMELYIAENEEDREEIKQGQEVVLINITDGPTQELLGPQVNPDRETSTRYPLESEALTVNRGRAYETFPEWIYRNDSRQGGRINLATLVDFKKPV